MSDGNGATIHAASDGGVAGTHPDGGEFELLVAPSGGGNEQNTVRLRLIPIACWRVDDIRFAFDSSFVTPDIQTELVALWNLRELHSVKTSILGQGAEYPTMSVFGHADPTGNDDYNKALSGRRAAAIYALLISQTDRNRAIGMWTTLAAQENWKADQRTTMQDFTGLPQGTSDHDLIAAYLDKLCTLQDFFGQPVKDTAGNQVRLTLAKNDFLGGGVDTGGKADYQGCSSFNPLLIFSQNKEALYEQAEKNKDRDALDERNSENASNRRVLVLLFRSGSKVDTAKWPCPRADEPLAGCTKRFWSDWKARRKTRLPDDDREYTATHDTFACRFYDRLTNTSPCEAVIQRATLTIRLIDDEDQLYDELLYRLEVGGQVFDGNTVNGEVRHEIRVGSPGGTLTLFHKQDGGDPLPFWQMDLDIGPLPDSTAAEGAQARLNNLGLFAGENAPSLDDPAMVRALQRFQARFKVATANNKIENSGKLTPATSAALTKAYGS